ncbi:MAG: P-loop NTPase, partial [Candidatus Dormibacteria bacterium]
ETLVGSESSVEVCGIARTPATLLNDLRALMPDVVLIRERFGGVDARALAEDVPDLSPGTRVVLLTDDADARPPFPALPMGVEFQLPAHPSAAELLAALDGSYDPMFAPSGDNGQPDWAAPDGAELVASDWAAEMSPSEPAWDTAEALSPGPLLDRPELVAAPVAGSVPLSPIAPGPDAEPIQEVVPRRPGRRSGRRASELFVVFAGKGGVGKSVVSTNLSAALAKDGARVAIIDLDLQFGDVGVMLGVEHPHTIEELVPLGDQMETEFLEEILGTGPEGVRVLLAPTSPELADLVTAGTLRAIIRELSKSYDYIVIDAAAHLEERTLEVIEMADHIVVVTAFNVTAVKDTKITLKLLQSLGIDREKIAVILNQTRAKTNFTREEVEDSLRFRIVTQLPFDPRIVDEAVDHGKPFVLTEPRSEITRQFRALVDYLVPLEEELDADGRPIKGKAKAKPKGRRFSLGRST